jgi:TrmH family RNA methyltransferase
MNFRLKRYKKDFEHSYAFGVFPTLELLEHKPADVLGVVINQSGLENTGVAKIKDLCQKFAIPFEIQQKSFIRIGAREKDYAVGVFRKSQPGLVSTTNHVILVNPSGMGNIGSIIRTMLGFNYLDLAIIGSSADVFHPDLVRASMGAFFQIRFKLFADFNGYQNVYPRHFYLLMTDGKQSLPDTKFETPYGLVFGSEGAGLPQEYHHYGISIKIPQNEAIDSLNLAVSVGVTLYHGMTNE